MCGDGNAWGFFLIGPSLSRSTFPPLNTLNTCKHTQHTQTQVFEPANQLFYSTYSRKWHDIKSASAGPLLLNDVHIVQPSLNISEGARSDYFVFSPRAVLLVTRVIICNSNSDQAVLLITSLSLHILSNLVLSMDNCTPHPTSGETN